MTGKTISHYRVLAKIGEGAAGVVYKADDLALGRGVALKFITPDQSLDAAAMFRFQHEARMASSLNHPNICTVYEIGDHGGSQFIAMELLEGKTLSRTIAGTPIPVPDLLSIAIQICDALDAAHTEGVIHRDLKPANVFVTNKHQVKILDFALAQFNPVGEPAQSQDVKVWGANTVGTVPYMSPEQINGVPLDSRSDLFSLGIILYEMATGRRAFGGSTTADMQAAILQEVTPEPRQVNPSVPTELNRIIVKALEKNRDLRYQTASDLRADLRRLKRDVELQGAPQPKRSPKQHSLPREFGRYAAGVTIALGLIVVGAASARRGRAVREPATAPRSNTPAPATALAPPPTQAPDIATRLDAAAPTAQPMAPASAVDAASAAQDLRVAKTMIRSGLQDQAAAKLATLVTDHPGTPEALDGYFLMAGIQEKRNRPNDAMATYLEIAERFIANPRTAEALYRVSQIILRSDRPSKLAEAQQTLDRVVREYGKSRWAPVALLAKGQLSQDQDVPAAIASYGQIAREYPKSEVHAEALLRLAGLYEKQKQYELAVETLSQLAKSHRGKADEAWFRAGEIYRRRLNNSSKARSAYTNVSASSQYYTHAQKYLRN